MQTPSMTPRDLGPGMVGLSTHDADDHDDASELDRGLRYDLATLVDRRRVLKLMGAGGVGLAVFGVAACAPPGTASSSPSPVATGTPGSTATSTPSSTTAADCDTAIPDETGGPYPADGTNGPDVLSESGVVRQDIRTSFGDLSGTADGVPLTIKLAIQDLGNGCAPLAGAAVYLWHCDQAGRYSLYSNGATDQNYLRGVQAAGNDGVVTFQSIFPACYSGRWPHIHFEVFPSLDEAVDYANVITTSQIALPRDACDAVYATAGYEQSVSNLNGVSLARDMVFGEDEGIRQIGSISGDVTSGMTVELAVPVNA